jgi:hypothetical protein
MIDPESLTIHIEPQKSYLSFEPSTVGARSLLTCVDRSGPQASGLVCE